MMSRLVCLVLALASAVAKPSAWTICNSTNAIKSGSCNDPTKPCEPNSGCTNAAKQPSLAYCEGLCEASSTCQGVTWHGPGTGAWEGICVLIEQGAWDPYGQGSHFSACKFSGCSCSHHGPPSPPPPPGPAPPTESECIVARTAYHKSMDALGGRGKTEIYDSLSVWMNLPACNVSKWSQPEVCRLSKLRNPSVSAGSVFYVSPMGSDSNDGSSETTPFRSIHKAQQAVRALSTKAHATVNMLAGTYYLGDPETQGSLVFTGADGGQAGAPVTWQGYPANAQVTISGGRLLKCEWQQSQVDGPASCVLPADVNFDELFVNGLRQVRARYPNGDPLTPKDGYSTGGKGKATFPRSTTPIPANVKVYGPTGVLLATVASPGPGGNVTVSDFEYPRNLSTTVKTAYANSRFNSTFNHPYWDTTATSEIDVPPDFETKKWANVTGAVVKMMHPNGWGSWAFYVESFDGKSMKFSRGGFQEARGGSGAGDMYIENVREELDAPGEFFLDTTSSTLLYMPPQGMDLKNAVVEVSQIPRVVQYRGTKAEPCEHMVLTNVNISHAAPTYLGSYEAPTGGDWSLHRGAALFIDGAVDITIDHVKFNQVGGNGAFLSNYVRNSSIINCDFWRTGDSAVLLVGSTPLNNGTSAAAQYPEGNIVSNNWMDTVGVYMKQVSCIFKSITSSTLIEQNICHDGPRAGFNYNDGFRGNSLVKQNVIWGMVRETGDHGTFNSWDRKEWFYDCDEDPSKFCFMPRVRTLSGNMLIGPAGWNFDLDDGSSQFAGDGNVVYQGGIKYRDGYFRKMTNNLMLGGAAFWFQVYGFPTDYFDSNVLDHPGPYCGPSNIGSIRNNTYAKLTTSPAMNEHKSHANVCDKGITSSMTVQQIENLARKLVGLGPL